VTSPRSRDTVPSGLVGYRDDDYADSIPAP
jgi:hypothetical protein